MTAPSPSGWIRATGNNPLLQRFLPHRIPETTERGNDTAARSIAAFRPFSVAWHNFGYPLQRQDACTDATPPVPAEIPSCMHTPDRKRTASRRPKPYSIMNKSTLTAAILLSAAVSCGKRSDTPGYAGEDLSSKVTVSRDREEKTAVLTVTLPGEWELYAGAAPETIDLSAPILTGSGAGSYTLPVPAGTRSSEDTAPRTDGMSNGAGLSAPTTCTA